MKKYLLSVFAAASMLFAASCSEEENFAESNKQSVTFKVEVEDAGASSRALTQGGKSVGKGSMIDRVHYAVYEANNGEFLTKGDAVMTPTEDGAVGSVVIPLVNGLSFDIVFFAHNEGGSAFTIPDDGNLAELEFKTTLKANQESYDAFYNTLTGFQVTNSSTTPVTLKRAVAQLNVGTTEADLSYADALKALATMSKITLTNVPTKFNARTGEVDDRTSVTFDASNILMDANWVKDAPNANPYGNEMLENVKTSEGEKDFYYLAMAYVLAGDESALHDATFTFYRGDDANKEIISERSLSSVRLQRNYRTNVTGNVLTQQEKFDVSLDINFGGDEHNYSVGDVVIIPSGDSQALQAAIDNAQPNVPVEIQLEGDITLGENNNSSTFSRSTVSPTLTIDKDKNIILDLNGCTITGTDNETASFGLITLKAGSNLSIINSAEPGGKITLTSTNDRDGNAYSSVISNQLAALTVGENVTIEHLGGTDMAYGIDNLTNGKGTKAVTTIDGATIKSKYRAIRQFLNGTEAFNELYVKSGTIESTGDNKSIWMQDPSAKANSGKLVVEAEAKLIGDVYFDITEGSTEWPVEVSIAASVIDDDSKIVVDGLLAGYEIEENDGVYSVVCNYSVAGDIYSIYTADGLKWVADEVNKVEQYAKNIFDGKTVKLANDINLQGADWIPIGDFGNSSNQFTGTFDGDGKTISNFIIKYNENKVDTKARTSFGFFGNVKGTVKNLTLSEVINDINTPKFVGVLIGRLNGGLVENCHVKNSSIEINNWTIGGLVGQFNDGKISGCSVENTTVKGYGAVGAITGIALGEGERIIENCSVKGCTLVQNGSFGDDYDKMFGAVVGALYSEQLSVNINGCAVEETTIKEISSNVLCGHVSKGSKLYVDGFELVADGVFKKGVEYNVNSAEGLAYMNTIFADKTAGRDVVLNLEADIDFTGKTWTPVDSHADTAFEIAEINGNGHTISNLTIDGQAMFKRFAGTGDVIIKDVTFDNANINSTLNGIEDNSKIINTSILTIQSYQNVLLDNVDVKNSTITGGYKVATLIGTVYNENTSTITATLKNCDVENVTVKAVKYDFCTAGMVAFVYEGDNDKVVFENCTVQDVKLMAKPNGYTSHAAIYVNDAATDDCFNEAEGVTVTNVTFEALQ